MEKLFAVMVAAHVVGDFPLQPDWLVERKGKASCLFLHALIHGGVAYLALQAWTCWQAPVLIVLLHVLVGYLEGIGFLVAAKSILRFKETEEQKMAEYVLVGTLLSFSLAIALAWVTKRAMGW